MGRIRIQSVNQPRHYFGNNDFQFGCTSGNQYFDRKLLQTYLLCDKSEHRKYTLLRNKQNLGRILGWFGWFSRTP